MKKFLQKKNVLSRTIVTLLTMAMLSGSITTTALAAEPIVPDVAVSEIAVPEVAVSEVASQANNENEGIMPLASGYAAHYTDTFQGSFYINVTGSSSIGHAKIKAWDFGSNDVDVYVTLYRPNGSVALSSIKLPIGTEVSKSFTNLPAGSYKLSYVVYTNVYKGWIYCNLS